MAPEVPGHVCLLGFSLWASLLGVDEVGELHGILNEEHGGVVSDDVVVAFFGVDLESEASWVSIAVVGTSLTGYGGES